MVDREKVIKGLLHCTRTVAGCNGCPYNDFESSCRDLKRDALELLKEQEARKPIYNEQKYGDHLPRCGNCEKVLPNTVVYGKVNFCHYCGRAVKWGEP